MSKQEGVLGMSGKTFKMSRSVSQAYCDHRWEAKLSYLLATAQQISMEHCDSLGIGGGYFRDRGYAFLLAKLRLDIARPITGGQVLELATRPNLPVRAQYRRLTDFASSSGEMLATMDARWVLVDIESRRLLRRLPDGLEMPFLDPEELSDFRPLPAAELEQCEDVTVGYSMLDINRHVNNTVYADTVTNLLGEQLLGGKRVASFEIFYHREALYNDVITLWRSLEDERFYIKGCVGDAACFEAQGTLTDLDSSIA